MYEGKADWQIIAQVKQAVRIPVIGNGDVCTPLDAQRMLDETGCDAVMVGRAALGNPWVIKQMVAYVEEGILCTRSDPRDADQPMSGSCQTFDDDDA